MTRVQIDYKPSCKIIMESKGQAYK